MEQSLIDGPSKNKYFSHRKQSQKQLFKHKCDTLKSEQKYLFIYNSNGVIVIMIFRHIYFAV